MNVDQVLKLVGIESVGMWSVNNSLNILYTHEALHQLRRVLSVIINPKEGPQIFREHKSAGARALDRVVELSSGYALLQQVKNIVNSLNVDLFTHNVPAHLFLSGEPATGEGLWSQKRWLRLYHAWNLKTRRPL